MSIYSSKLNVCIVYSNTFKELAGVTCSSYKNNNILVHLNKIKIPDIDGDTFFTKEWRDSLKEKISFSNSIFHKMDYDDALCVADADVYCLNSDRIYDLRKEIKDRDLDMLGQTNWFEQYYEEVLTDRLMINCGFFVLRKTKRSHDFLDKVLDYDFSKFDFAEQDIINEVILRSDHGLKYKTISPTEYILGCYLDRVIALGDLNVSLIHTTCTSNVDQKKQQIDRIVSESKLKKVNWNNTKIHKREVLYYTDGQLDNNYRNTKYLSKLK
jgi:hypothetical protein